MKPVKKEEVRKEYRSEEGQDIGGNMQPNNAINSASQKRRFALLLAAGYVER